MSLNDGPQGYQLFQTKQDGCVPCCTPPPDDASAAAQEQQARHDLAGLSEVGTDDAAYDTALRQLRAAVTLVPPFEAAGTGPLAPTEAGRPVTPPVRPGDYGRGSPRGCRHLG